MYFDIPLYIFYFPLENSRQRKIEENLRSKLEQMQLIIHKTFEAFALKEATTKKEQENGNKKQRNERILAVKKGNGFL
jgi:hypothetical protein